MASLNKAFLMGNLTRDPELRYIPSGTAVATFTVAVSRVYKSPTGEKKEQVSFIRVVVWGRRAEVCGEYLSKGSPVFIEGRIQSRDWQTQDGQKRNTVEIVADNVQFLRMGPKNDKSASGQAAPAVPAQPEEVDSIDLNEDPDKGAGDKVNSAGNAASSEEAPF